MNSDDRISRRDLLRGGFLKGLRSAVERVVPVAPVAPTPARAIPSSRADRHLPVHRPPGAVDEATFLAECTRCRACIEACPHDAITLAPPQLRKAVSTPIIDPYTAACHMCEDLPCIASCEPRVLRFDAPVKMATARVITGACLAHTGSFCSVCVERCPVPGALKLVKGKPIIDPEACTGCGMCFEVCPAPGKAIAVMPLMDRPPAKPQPEAPPDDVAPSA